MSIRTLAARGLSFAHLAGLSARGSRAEGDEPEDEDKKGARRAEDDEPDEKDDDKRDAKGSRADDDELADDESEEKEEKDDKAKGKRAKAAEDDEDEDGEKDERADDDDDDEEMRGKSAIAKARRREQARCAAIFASPAAARNPVLAANLAFKGRMPRSEAIAMLESTPAPASAAHAQRSSKNPNLGVDGGAKPTKQQATAARWDANLQAANPSHRR